MAFLCAAIAADFCMHKHLQIMVRNFGSWHSIRVHIDVGQQQLALAQLLTVDKVQLG